MSLKSSDLINVFNAWFNSLRKEFNPSFNNQMHLIPDNNGLTLQQLIIDNHKEEFFPFLQFDKNLAHY